MAVDALIFLSNSSLYKAELANKVLMTVSPSSITEVGSVSAATVDSELRPADESTGDSMIYEGSSSGRILLHPNHKKMDGSSRMRISGLIGVPTGSTLTPSDAANDLFFLEKKLAELGLMSGVNPSNRNTGTLRSALGESFMLLSTSSLKQSKIRRAQLSASVSIGDKFSHKISPLDMNEIQSDIGPKIDITDKDDIAKKKGINSSGIDNSCISNNDEKNQNSLNATFVDAPGGPYGGSKKSKVKSQLNTSLLEKQKQNTISKNFWLPNPLDILTWRGTTGTATNNSHPKEAYEISDQNDIEENQFDLQWNDDQSMYASTPVKKSSNDLLTAPTPTANNHNSELAGYDHDNVNIQNDGGNDYEVSDSSRMPESVLRLLQCIKRLGDENMSLLQRIGMNIKSSNVYCHVIIIKSLSFNFRMNPHLFYHS
jgi:hypothetical protein